MGAKNRSKAMRQLKEITGSKITTAMMLRAIRECDEMSQAEFSSLLGITRHYLSDVECGRRFLSPKKASEFAKILDYSESQFIRVCLQDMLDRDGINAEII